VLGSSGICRAVQEVRVMVAIGSQQHFRDMPRKPAAFHTGTPRCISQVAAVWRKVWASSCRQILVQRDRPTATLLGRMILKFEDRADLAAGTENRIPN